MPQLLRIATAGSVDDGKSTLIGRLLYDSKAIFADQLASVEQASQDKGQQSPDLSLLTDGLRAEREQGITIDVAYRYFATPRRKFIIADTPGHVQYTRNMVTGASTADVALILLDGRKGVLEQSRRHAFLASLLGIPHLLLCVNKMDLIDYSQPRFEQIREEFASFAMKLEIHDLSFIPLSALTGDNVVTVSDRMPWYQGSSLLHHLEQLHVASDRNLIDARLPVQYVIRPKDDQWHDFRGYAGTVAGGVFQAGDQVTVLPSGFSTTVRTVWAPGGQRADQASAGQAITMELADDIDIGRGDLICRPANRPQASQDIDAVVCWFSSDSALTAGSSYSVLHTTRSTRATVKALDYRLDINSLHRDTTAVSLSLNEIGRVRLRTRQPLLFDPYRRNRTMGSFILIDDTTNNTVAAGMITGPSQPESTIPPAGSAITREQRATRGLTVWLTGLPGAGKTSLGVELERRIVASGRGAYLLDSDTLRRGLSRDLGFTATDRMENVRRVAAVAELIADAGLVSIVSLVSPYRADRAAARAAHEEAGLPFLEVFLDTPLEVCEQRDSTGLYSRARAGEVAEFTGISSPYEAPQTPEIHLRPEDGDVLTVADRVFSHVDALIG